MTGHRTSWLQPVRLMAALIALAAPSAQAQTVIDEWATIKAPAPPAVKDVTIADGKTTALLIMDVNTNTCTVERRPRCASAMPRLQALLETARAKGAVVIYTLSGTTTSADIIPAVAAKPGDPVLPSFGPDKFIGNDMEKILKERGIKTVITTGTGAHTSVLYTGAAASLRGYDVVVPIDVIASDQAYQEQYTLLNLTTTARVMTKVTLTTTQNLKF